MTPLPRWVFLGLLLAGPAEHQDADACVHLCRAERARSPEIAGVCEHHQKHVLQSYGGRFRRQLFSLCLTPCAGSPERFDDSLLCRVYRRILIKHASCSCDDSRDDGEKAGFEEDASRVEGPVQDPAKLSEAEIGRILRMIAGSQASVRRPILDSWMMEVEEKARFLEAARAGSDNASPGREDSTEASVDWEKWCVAQCDNGLGGSACNCDIIP